MFKSDALLYTATALIILSIIVFIYFIIRSIKHSDDPKYLTVKEILVDLGLFFSLITSIVAFISVIFTTIEKRFFHLVNKSESVTEYSYYDSYNDIIQTFKYDVKWAISIVAIAFPLYLALAYYKSRRMVHDVERSRMPAMRYVNDFIIGVSVLFILGTLIKTLYQYLDGDFVVTFGFKVLSVLVIMAILLVYNFYFLKRDFASKSIISYVFAAVSVLIVAGTLIYCISIIGSPSKVRNVSIDNNILEDLSKIQNEVYVFWDKNKYLPTSTADLIVVAEADYDLFLPLDPRDSKAYDYKIITNSSIVQATGTKCVDYYVYKYDDEIYDENNLYTPNKEKVSKLNCEIPTKAVFEICANFKTVRLISEDGDDISQVGWNSNYPFGSDKISRNNNKDYFSGISYDSGYSDPTWNHDSKYTCFKRVVDPEVYKDYGYYNEYIGI